MSFFSYIFDLVRAGGIPVLFILVILEGNPIIGSFIPGQVLAIFMGMVLATNTTLFQLVGVIILLFVGSLLGDIIGYYMGQKIDINNLKRFGLSKTSTIYKSSEKFFNKYGLWSIILGRELNFTRAFMPFLAGQFDMPKKKFFITAATSCAIWASLSILLGYYFGTMVIQHFQFVMEFAMFLIIYLSISSFIYGKFKTFYDENTKLIHKHSLHNIFYLGIFIPILILMILFVKTGLVQLFNDFFIFIFIPGFYYFTAFLFSGYLLLPAAISIIAFVIYKKNYKLMLSIIWASILVFLFNSIFFIFLDKTYGIDIYNSIIFFNLLIFYFWILFRKYIKSILLRRFLKFILVTMSLLVIISIFSETGNFFFVIFSFILVVIETEFILLLSHYKILDENLSISRY